MFTYAKFDQTMPSGYKAFNNDRITAKEWTAAEATGCLNALWRQIVALDSAGFLLKHNVLNSNKMSNLCKTLQQRNKLSMIW